MLSWDLSIEKLHKINEALPMQVIDQYFFKHTAHTHTYTPTPTHTHVHIHTHTHTHTHTYTHTYTHTFIYMYIYLCIYIYTNFLRMSGICTRYIYIYIYILIECSFFVLWDTTVYCKPGYKLKANTHISLGQYILKLCPEPKG
jgi:hypothetical protein